MCSRSLDESCCSRRSTLRTTHAWCFGQVVLFSPVNSSYKSCLVPSMTKFWLHVPRLDQCVAVGDLVGIEAASEPVCHWGRCRWLHYHGRPVAKATRKSGEVARKGTASSLTRGTQLSADIQLKRSCSAFCALFPSASQPYDSSRGCTATSYGKCKRGS